jgi:hypothetical protein
MLHARKEALAIEEQGLAIESAHNSEKADQKPLVQLVPNVDRVSSPSGPGRL